MSYTITRHGKLSYYNPIGQNSFNIISTHHIRELRKLPSPSKRWTLIHPIFYFLFEGFNGGLTYKSLITMPTLRSTSLNVGGFDLADSDAISPWAVKKANELDLIMVPSKCSKRAYKKSGVKTRVEVVPHGLSENYNAPKNPLPLRIKPTSKKQTYIKILYFQWHSSSRKGGKIVHKVMQRILHERRNVRFIFKGKGFSLKNTTRITNYLSEKDIVRLYDACDILICPSRGGGFELNVLEALARGLVVITSDWAAIQEYAKKHVLTIKSTHRQVKPLFGNAIHIGYGVDPDVRHCHELVNYAIDNLDGLKKRAEKNMLKIRKKFTWKKTAKKIMKCIT